MNRRTGWGMAAWGMAALILTGQAQAGGVYQCSRAGVKVLRSTPCAEGEITRSAPDPAQLAASAGEACRLYPYCANDAIPYVEHHNVMKIPVLLGDKVVKEFMVDTGASFLTMDSETLKQLVKAKVVPSSLGLSSLTIADGSKSDVLSVLIPSLQVGRLRLTDVEARISPSPDAMRLLGMNVLNQIQWRADRKEKLFFVQ